MAGRSSLMLLIVFISIPALPVGAGELSPGRFTQHDYELFENYSLSYQAARAACAFRGGHLDIPVLQREEIDYRSPELTSILSDIWFWAPMQKMPLVDQAEKDHVWRWFNGSKVDVSNKKRLKAHDVTTKESCVVWNRSSGYFPENCDQRHSFMCLINTTTFCRMRNYYTSDYDYSINWTEKHKSFDSVKNATDHFLKTNETVVFSRVMEINKGKVRCRNMCNDIHSDLTLPLGCWFAQVEYLKSPKQCHMVLAPSFPQDSYRTGHVDGTQMFFRTCFRQVPYKEDCLMQCGCTAPTAPTTLAEAEAENKRIKSKLTLPKANLSATVRRKTSAPDGRPSAKAVGAVGVSVISGLLVLVVVLDMAAIRRDLRKLKSNIAAGRFFALKPKQDAGGLTATAAGRCSPSGQGEGGSSSVA